LICSPPKKKRLGAILAGKKKWTAIVSKKEKKIWEKKERETDSLIGHQKGEKEKKKVMMECLCRGVKKKREPIQTSTLSGKSVKRGCPRRGKG